MNVSDHIDKIDGVLDGMAGDPDVTAEEYIEACDDIVFRVRAASRSARKIAEIVR